MFFRSLTSAGLVALALMATPGARAACNDIGMIPSQATLYHGAPVPEFVWRGEDLNPAPPFAHGTVPDGPAWFAFNWQFSVHAGLRFLTGQDEGSLTLFQYRPSQDLAVLDCDSHSDFGHRTGIDVDRHEDIDVARAFCSTIAPDQYNGYLIRSDRVRREPELILCDPNAVLTTNSQHRWSVQQVVESGIAYTGAATSNFGGNDVFCVLNNANLGIFACNQRPAAVF